MKRVCACGAVLLLALMIFAGCASTSSLASGNDPVDAIKKLAKKLNKDSADQEAADVFDEIYNREMENNLVNIETSVGQIMNEFAESQGKTEVKDALAVVVGDLPNRTAVKAYTVMNSIEVQKVEASMTNLKNAYFDLKEILFGTTQKMVGA